MKQWKKKSKQGRAAFADQTEIDHRKSGWRFWKVTEFVRLFTERSKLGSWIFSGIPLPQSTILMG
ncbi:MAG: hypothetical protein C0478_13065 [Planctomyces sp.]|nr:hypothetical protein [Planctomyces sp.]